MRALVLLAACLLAGCSAPDDNDALPAAAPPGVDVLGDVAVTDATLLPATYGEGVPAAPMRVLARDGETRAAEGQGVSLALGEGGARLRLANHGAWVRTSLRVEDPACVVTLRTVTGDAPPLAGGHVSLDNALGPEYPYHDYAFSGACEGRLFLLWRG
jgi:hypothetical protein